VTTLYPTAFDDFSNPAGDQSQAAGRTHSQQHGDLNDAIEAVQHAIGLRPVGVTDDLETRVGSLGTDLAGNSGATLVAYLDDGTGASARTLDTRIREKFEVNVLSYIPSTLHASIKAGTCTTQLHSYIQLAIDAIATIGGGRVFFPEGVYRIGATLTVSKSHTTLVGLGGGHYLSGQANIRASALSRIEWDPNVTPAAGTAIVRFANPVNGNYVAGGGIDDIMLDGQTVCPIGLNIVSWNRARFRRVTAYACTADSFLLETANYTLIQTAGASQNNHFEQCFASTSGGSGWYLTALTNGWRFKGGSSFNSGDSSQNVLDNCTTIMSLGTPLVIENCGQNLIRHFWGSSERNMTAPTVTATPSASGGTLASGTKSYKVQPRSNTTGEVCAASVAATCSTTGSTGAVVLTWPAVTGATHYDVYGRTAGSEFFIATVTALTYTDTGSVTPSGATQTAHGAYGVILGSSDQATNSGAVGVARYNCFMFCEATFWARASQQVGGGASFGNMVIGVSNGNANTSPIIYETPTNNTSYPMVTYFASGTSTAPSSVVSGKFDIPANTPGTPGYFYNGTKVLGARDTGWTAGTGTPNKGAFGADTSISISATYTQSEIQTIVTVLIATKQRVLALEQMARAHGLLN
jgi:hypothetical protein